MNLSDKRFDDMKHNEEEKKSKGKSFVHYLKPAREETQENENRNFMTQQETEEKEETEKNEKTKLNLSPRFFVAIVVIGVFVLLYSVLSASSYNSYDVVEETSIKNAVMVDYIPYQKSLLKYSKDGATYVDEKDRAVWNETYVMKMPVADVSGEYIAIADLNGNDVYVFNKEGKVSSTTMPYKICDIAVASQGEFAVVLESEKENYINIYDKNGDPISEIQTTLDKSGYPMDVDLSENGEKLFSTYLYLDGAQIKNGLAAYNFGPVGQNENADRLVGGYQLENTIVPKVEFLDNNTVCAFGDNQFIIYTMREKSSKKAEISFENEVRSVVYNKEYIGVVVPNEKKDNNGNPYVFELYSTSGKKVMSKPLDFDYDRIKMIGNEIVFTGGNQCRIYTVDGKMKFSYAFNKNVVDLIPTGYGRRYIVLYDSGSEVIRLTHESEKE